MNIEENFGIDNLFLSERKCRICGEVKDLMGGFYKTHKDATDSESIYSYECKTCTIKRVSKTKKKKHRNKHNMFFTDYPDW